MDFYVLVEWMVYVVVFVLQADSSVGMSAAYGVSSFYEPDFVAESIGVEGALRLAWAGFVEPQQQALWVPLQEASRSCWRVGDQTPCGRFCGYSHLSKERPFYVPLS